jgi:hypothetical protein
MVTRIYVDGKGPEEDADGAKEVEDDATDEEAVVGEVVDEVGNEGLRYTVWS